MAQIVARLADLFDVTYYSLVAVDPSFVPATYRLRSPIRAPDGTPSRGSLWPGLAARFLADHARRPFDVVMSFWGYPMGTFVVALAHLVRRPSMVLVLGSELARLPSIGYGQLQHPLRRVLVLQTCARATALVLISTNQLNILRGEGLVRPDVHVIPWGADRRMFRYVEKVRAPPLKIVHVANLTPVKDQVTLIRAFALVRRDIDARLRIVGPDFMSGAIQALVHDLALSAHVEFAGKVPHEAVAEHYLWADMFVLTSLSEGQNGALTEAVTCGVLPVSTEVGLATDLGAEAAVIVKMRDPVDIARKITAISTNPVAWKEKARRAHEWAVAHDLDWTIDRFKDLLEDIR